MDIDTMEAGDTVACRAYKGVACVVVGRETRAGETEVECYECGGTGETKRHPDDNDPTCLACDGTGALHDEEPEPIETGRVRLRMVGDDHVFAVDPEECKPLAREAYCGGCGQVGCTHDAYPRD